MDLFLYLVEVPGGFSREVSLKEKLRPLGAFPSSEVRSLPPGRYLLSNECQSMEFDLKSKEQKKLVFPKLSFSAGALPKPFVPVECQDPIDGNTNRWTDRTQFLVFPSPTSLKLAGISLPEIASPPLQDVTVVLGSVVLESHDSEARLNYYLLPQVGPDSRVFPLPVSKEVWLPVGTFQIEINGSRRQVVVVRGEQTKVPLGSLKVMSPKNFPMRKRIEKGSQPVFAYLADGVLLNLDQEYSVFAGEYRLNLEGSELSTRVSVESKQTTVVRAFGAQVNPPACPSATPCLFSQFVTLHRDGAAFSLLSVPFGVPFMVLEEKAEYGVEGLRGIHRQMKASAEGVVEETLSRLKIKWEIRASQNRMRTDLVRLEGKEGNPSGKSLDLLFTKPNELIVPPGHYSLTYFLGDPNLDRVKTKIDVNLPQGETREILVPIYVEKEKAKEAQEAKEEIAKPQSSELPKSLSPLRK